MNELTDGWFGLRWGVERSIRYHARREGYFGVLHRITSFVGVISGTAAAAALLKDREEWALAFTVFIAVVSGLDLVIGFSSMERKHQELRGRFCDLMSKLEGVPNDAVLLAGKCERTSIEKDEPAVFRALDLTVHNELMRARGYKQTDEKYREDFHAVGWFKRLTKHLFKWESLA